MAQRRRWRLLSVFLALLALSHFYCWEWPPVGTPRPGQLRMEAPVIDADGDYTGDTTPLYYFDLAPAGKPDAPVLVLIHGSWEASGQLDALVRELAPDFHLIVPDLPGFGASAAGSLPDYSAATDAQEIGVLLDHLGIPQANIAGFGMGGGVALEFADMSPARVQSLELINSIGVVEFQWLGDKGLNHALYGTQLWALTTARFLLPHFGWLDTGPVNPAYARIFWDTDQKGLRDVLLKYAGPMLIVQNEDDFFVQAATARESHRLVPQSELVTLPGGHWDALQHPEKVAELVRDFVRRADQGRTPVAADADPERIKEAALPMGAAGPTSRAYEAMLLSVLAVMTLFGEDAVCIGAGLLVARGVLGFWPTTLACLTGILAGNIGYYVAGWMFGEVAMRKPPLSWWIKEGDLKRLREGFNQRGWWLMFASRIIPGSRLPVFLSAGVLRFPFSRTLIALVISNGLWTPVFIETSRLLGDRMGQILEHHEKAAFLVVAGTVAAVLLVIHFVLPLGTWRGRRLLLMRWRQLTHWEFWPWWLVQAPAFMWIGRLAWKYRGLPVFTCANPVLPLGGIARSSKSAILRGLAGAGGIVARWILLDGVPLREAACGAARVRKLEAWMAEQGFVWPVILKPDIGGHGKRVTVCRNRDQAAQFLDDYLKDVVAQEYVPGIEFEIFYYRNPGELSGHLLVVTEKSFPSVTGTGQKTLEQLILADDRAVCSAQFFLAQHRARLGDVPAAGAVVPLVELGVHNMGAIFRDVTSSEATPQLNAVMDALSRTYDGFYFGRFELCCPSTKDLEAGRNLRVIGLRGITADDPSIYDSHRSLLEAWRMLCRQWEICFAIGAANLERGAPEPTWRVVLRALVRRRSKE